MYNRAAIVDSIYTTECISLRIPVLPFMIASNVMGNVLSTAMWHPAADLCSLLRYHSVWLYREMVSAAMIKKTRTVSELIQRAAR